MDEHFRRALSVVAGGEIFRTDLDGNYVFAQLNHRLLDEVGLPPSLAGDNPGEKEAEESEKKAEEAMVDSAECGAPSVSSLAREELRVAEAQVNEFVHGKAEMETGPAEGEANWGVESPSHDAELPKAPLSLTNAVTNAAVKIRDAIMGCGRRVLLLFTRPLDGPGGGGQGADIEGVVCRRGRTKGKS